MSSKISPEEPIAIITQAELDALHTRLDNLETAATRRIGLRRELELELFCEVLPIQSDGGEASYQRALAEIRRLKAQAPAAEVREALVELVRLKDLKFAHPEK
ncbi:MAG: hypothetical protein Q4C67_11280, partial [Deinococcus sp.]|nr:hypothetical protein [Deinococcus sp.]